MFHLPLPQLTNQRLVIRSSCGLFADSWHLLLIPVIDGSDDHSMNLALQIWFISPADCLTMQLYSVVRRIPVWVVQFTGRWISDNCSSLLLQVYPAAALLSLTFVLILLCAVCMHLCSAALWWYPAWVCLMVLLTGLKVLYILLFLYFLSCAICVCFILLTFVLVERLQATSQVAHL